mgnify:CR=1 FL=1
MIRWYYYICRWAILFYLNVVTRLKVEGLENVPKTGPVLIVANHLNNSDPPLVSVTLNRNAIFMAKEELFRNRILSYIIFGLGAFPVHRGQVDRKAIRHAESVLKNGMILVMFPESHRSKDARLQEAQPGSALIASRNDVPILPVAITGTEKMSDWKFIFHRPQVLITYGIPFKLPASSTQGKKKNLEELTDFIMSKIAEILPEEYQGFYSMEKTKK